jgi:quinol monooxygenase YgiN
MIIVNVEVNLEEEMSDDVREAFRIMDEETAKETGCIKYVSSIDVNDPKIIRIYEMWESMDELIPHFKTPHMANFQKALGSLKTKGMDAKVYEISKELPFPN